MKMPRPAIPKVPQVDISAQWVIRSLHRQRVGVRLQGEFWEGHSKALADAIDSIARKARKLGRGQPAGGEP